MLDVIRDLRHGARLLRRAPGFTAVAVLVLALGIGVNTAMFSLVDTLVLQPRPGRIDQLSGVFSRDRNRPDQYQDFSYGAYVDLRDQAGVFDSLMAHTFSLVGIANGDATRQSFVAIVSANYFATLGVTPAVGRAFTLAEERPGANARVLIAAYSLWQRAGLDPGFLGSTVRVNGGDFTVVGVAPRGFGGTTTLFSPEYWFPLGSYDIVVSETFKAADTGLTDRRNRVLNLAGALRDGVTPAAAEQALDITGRRLGAAYPATDADQTFVLAGLPRMSISSRPQSAGPGTVFSGLLMLMSLLVLVVASLNLANLLLARGAARRKEMAIRQALGSGRWRIVQQLLIEGLMLSTAGAAAGIVIGWWASGAIAAFISRALPLGLQIVLEPSLRLIPAAAALALFSTLFFAIGPALSLSRYGVAADLKGELGATARASRRLGVGSLLVVGQLALSLALVASGGLFVRAAINAANIDPGFSIERHVIVSMDPSMAGSDATRSKAFYREALARVRAMPGVERASVAAIVPFGEIQESRRVRLKPSDEPVSAEFNVVGADYFAALGMPVLRGREFTRAEEEATAGTKPVVIDRALAQRVFAAADPIGRQVLLEQRDRGSEPFVVVGVVTDTRHDALDIRPLPHVFVPTGALNRLSLTMHVRTAAGTSEAGLLGGVVREMRVLDPAVPILSARTMAEQRYRSLAEWGMRAAAAVFSAFGLLAVTLATVGVYGLLAYEVARRTREIGIRIALGATARNVVLMVLGEGARATLIAVGVGVLLAAGLGKLASGLLYQVSPVDPIVLSASAAILSMAAMAATYVPARRATRVTPLEALRSE